MKRLCAGCGHPRHAHEHYDRRDDTRCGLCQCTRYRRRWPWRRGTEDTSPAGWSKPPAARVATPLPGHTPTPGQATSTPPSDAQPGVGPTLTVEFYPDGSIKIFAHRHRRKYHIPGDDIPPVDLSDAALEKFIRDNQD